MLVKIIFKRIILFILVLSIITGCGGTNKSNSYLATNNNLAFKSNKFIDKIFSNVDLSEGKQQYHFENILIFFDLYSSMYDKNISKKFNDFLYKNYLKRKEQIAENLKSDKNRLNLLQFLYLYSQNIKNNLEYNNYLNKKDLEKFSDEYMFLVSDIILPFWYDYPAWHWLKKYPNMEERITAKIEKNNPEMLKRSYYTAFIDEDGFSCAITSDLLYINHIFSNNLNIKLDSAKLEKLENIRNKCTKIIKQKSIFNKDNFHFDKGAWSDHPDFAYAGCDGKVYPKHTCIDKTIEPDTSHFSRFPWWITSIRDTYDINSSNYIYFNNWLKSFSIHFQKKILVKKENIYLLTNFINGKNGWFRIKYHSEYKDFGYGAYQLSLISALGSYYTLAKYNPKLCSYIKASSFLFESNDNLYRHYYEEKYPTSYTKFLKDINIYKDRFEYYNLLTKMAHKIWCHSK